MYIYNMSKKGNFLYLICIGFCVVIMQMKAQESNTHNPMTLIQPEYLKPGDTVAIVAPSGILKNREDEIGRATELLKSWGLHVKLGANVFNQDDHFAGTDDERCEDFQNALDDPNIKGIWCARGGYGTVRILDKLDYTEFRKHPKWIIGYSDITAIHNQVHNEGFESIHAMMCVSLTEDMEDMELTISTFRNAIFGNPIRYELKGSKYNRTGTVTAPLVGGNLTMLHTMLGSNTSIDTTGKILFIEEIGEYKYHIDRMLQSLKRAGYFDNCKGVIVGDMSKLRKNTTLWGTSIEQLILDALSDYDFPIAFNMPAGHEKDNRALIFGKEISLNVSKKGTKISY